MHIQKINVNGVSLQKNSTNFKSRVVYEISQTPLSSSVKDFIDTFEERFPKQSSGKRSAEKRYSNNGFTVFDIKSGESGIVYMIEPNNGGRKFVMKESFPLRYKSRYDSDLGGLRHEYNAMVEASSASERAQKPIAYVRTENGSSFLLSEYMSDIVPANFKTASEGKSGLEMGEPYFTTVLEIIDNFDEKDLFDPDMTRDNVSINKNDKTAKILDFQWALLSGTHSKNNNAVFTFARCEAETNCAAFEGGALADYPIGELKELRKQQMNQNFSVSIEEKKKEIRDKLKQYFMIRADYAEKLADRTGNDFERVKAQVYRNPSDDVIDAELLRMSILRNNRLQFLYTDDNIERPRNMMKLIRYSALAKLSAKKLSEFKPQYPFETQEEREYFEYMREFGKSWNNNASNWYPGTVDYLKRVVEGKDRAPGRYFPELLGTTKDEIFTLFQVMESNNVNKEMRNINKKVSELENKIMDIKSGEYVSSYEINSLVRELYSY